jgi:hypothetical protein
MVIHHYSKFLSNPQLFANSEGEDPFIHSQRIDQQLGLNTQRVEAELRQKFSAYNCSDSSLKPYPAGEAWIGLGSDVLQTPYQEIFEALDYLKIHPPKHLVDLGAGYARLYYPLKALYPSCQFTGHEFVKERVNEGKRALEANAQNSEVLKKVDVLDPNYLLPKADCYFIYDFEKPKDISSILNLFVEKFEKDDFFLIVKGKATRSMIHNRYPILFRPYGAIHFENISIYSSFFELCD